MFVRSSESKKAKDVDPERRKESHLDFIQGMFVRFEGGVKTRDLDVDEGKYFLFCFEGRSDYTV